MSTTRCDHGNVVSDTVGDYRCFQCEPLEERDLELLEEAVQEELDEQFAVRDRRIAELAARAGVTFTPPEDE